MSLKNPQALRTCLRKPPASHGFSGIFKNADFSWSSLKAIKLSKFQHFFFFKIYLSLLLMVVPSSSVNKKRLKHENAEFYRLFTVIYKFLNN